MMRRKKIIWKQNDVFVIPLKNYHYAVGHVLDQRMVNTIRIALYSEVIKNMDVDLANLIDERNLISLIEVTREQLDYGVWKIVGNKQTSILVERYANEQFRTNKWINSIVHDAALAEDFINSFHGLLAWDDWYNPNYLDDYLIDPSKKPNNLIYKK
jgi:hypothetical protein